MKIYGTLLNKTSIYTDDKDYSMVHYRCIFLPITPSCNGELTNTYKFSYVVDRSYIYF